MGLQTFEEALVSAFAAGPTLSNSTAATSLLNAQDKWTFPNGYWRPAGKLLRVSVQAQVSNIVTTPGTLTLDLRLGSNVIASSGALQLNTTANTTLPVWYQFLLTLRAVGSSSNFMVAGVSAGVPLGTGAAVGTVLLPATAPAVGANFDESATQQLDHFATFSVANAGNAITMQQFVVEVLN